MEELQDTESPKTKMEVEEPHMEKEITCAMRKRIGHFKDQADLLTLEGVRRLLEKDLGLETFALDVHKRFIKQCLQECFDSANDESVSKNLGENMEKIPKREGTEDLSEVLQMKKELKASSTEDEEKRQGSPVLGLLAEDETNQDETEDTRTDKSVKAPTEETIKNAVKERASYFRTNSHQISLVGVRRLLEEDLKLEKNALDPFKKFISAELDEVLQSPQIAEPSNGLKNKKTKKESHIKKSAKVSSEGSSESSESEEEVEEDEEKPKRKTAPKVKVQKPQGLKNRKRPAKETKPSSNKRIKPEEPMSEGSNDANDGGNLSDNGHSQSSAEEEPVKKKKDVSNNVYGKRVEHLKSVIRSCGMGVPPAVYKRAKQAPESKREAYLIKELEDMLAKEGLSTNPTEKEIKAVKKNKERTKELEGIDVSNIVSSSRRRSSFNFIAPPKPKVPVESDGEEDSENEDDEDDDDDDDNNSEESNDDVEDESD